MASIADGYTPSAKAELARLSPCPLKGEYKGREISLFGKTAPLKKLIILEQDKGNINLKVDFPFTAAGNARRKGSFGIVGYLEKAISRNSGDY